MSFGALHRIQCEIGKQAEEVSRARATIYLAMIHMEETKDDPATVDPKLYTLIKQAYKILEKIAK